MRTRPRHRRRGTAEHDGGATEIASVRRSLPNGRTDIIKAMGNTRWGDIDLR
jgi:hypothetical protein